MSPKKKTTPGIKLALLGVYLTILMSTLDVSVVNVALPTLVNALQTNFATIQWVVVSYLLVITSFMLMVSRLGDMLGKKRLFTFGLLLFTLSSLLCGLATDVWCLIGCRALQGLGAVMTQALGAAIIAEVVPPNQLGRAMGYVGGTVSLGLTAGPSLGGVLIGFVSWQSIFLINVPIGVFAFWVVHNYLPVLEKPVERESFDMPGAIMSLLALGCYALGMTMGQDKGFSDAPVMALLGVACAGGIVFLWRQTKALHPMLDLELFKNPLLSLNLAMSFMVFIGTGSVYILPFFFELVQNYNPAQIGLLLVVVPLLMGLVSPLAGKLSDTYGSRGLGIVGLTLYVIGAALVSTMQIDTPWWGYVLRATPMGVGMGLFQAPNNSAIMAQAPRHRLGVVSGLLNYSRTVGQTTGIPLQGSIFTAVVLAHAHLAQRTDFSLAPKQALVDAFSFVHYVIVCCAGSALCLGVIAYRIDKRKSNYQLREEMS